MGPRAPSCSLALPRKPPAFDPSCPECDGLLTELQGLGHQRGAHGRQRRVPPTFGLGARGPAWSRKEDAVRARKPEPEGLGGFGEDPAGPEPTAGPSAEAPATPRPPLEENAPHRPGGDGPEGPEPTAGPPAKAAAPGRPRSAGDRASRAVGAARAAVIALRAKAIGTASV
ncbi:unnamed protein product [Prorocentrum cordatum]|uniref:C2H2-type domain-containing protein n=1 Tax=Prorocentrum cordatum TaxID=2364126 RepID=A0ABN9TEB8_9DINO|nr:unnamed protein product [Polarella glacialis]